MAYNIGLTNGTQLVSVADGTTDSSYTSLTLIGKNFAGYGYFQNQNFVKILENFSNTTAPANPLQGQIWWDSSRKILKVYTSSDWKAVSSSTSAATSPPSPVTGDLWWDTATGQFKVWGGTAWTVIGPAFTSSSQTGAIPDVVTGSLDATSHNIVKFYASGTLVSVLSHDPTFEVSSLPGFNELRPGFNVALGHQYVGDATNSLKLGGSLPGAFMRNGLDGPSITSSRLTVQNNDGALIGAGGELDLNIGSNGVNFISTVTGRDANFFVKVAGVSQRGLQISGVTGLVTVLGNPTVALGVATKQYADGKVAKTGDVMTGPLVLPADPTLDLQAATKQYVDVAVSGSNTAASLRRDGANTITGNITADTNNTRNLGSAAIRFATVFATTFNGTAVSANYADLAERFEADAVYEPGTLVSLGGNAEITLSDVELSDEVFGVISTNAAYLMNAAAGSNATHPAVAVQGRVPVRVIGLVNKGDRLVSAGNGFARAANRSEWTAFNIIGRALESKTTSGSGVIEAIVKLNS